MCPAAARPSVLPRREPPPGSRKYRAILDAAEEIFGARGFKKAAVDEIAAQARVSKPLIYRYFTSKKHLFEVVVDRVITQWNDVITAEGARVTPSAAHSLRLIIGASLEFARSRGVPRGLLARESQLMLAGYSDVLDRGTETLRSVLTEALERGVRDGDVRADLRVQNMADVITQVCVSFGERLVSNGVRDRDSDLLDGVIETMLFGVIAKKSATVQG